MQNKPISYDEAQSKLSVEMAEIIRGAWDTAYDLGLQAGLKRTAKIYPKQESQSQLVIVRDASDSLIADVYGVIDEPLSDGQAVIHVESRGTVILRVTEIEEEGV